MKVLRFAGMKGWEVKVWKLRFVRCIVLHLDSEELSIRFHFERVWNRKDKEKWGAVSAWRV